MLPFGEPQRANTLRAARYDAAFIVAAVGQQLRVQLRQVARLRIYGEAEVAMLWSLWLAAGYALCWG